jgi:hypothetical protein
VVSHDIHVNAVLDEGLGRDNDLVEASRRVQGSLNDGFSAAGEPRLLDGQNGLTVGGTRWRA